MIVNGLDLSNLPDGVLQSGYAPPVPGRVALIDGDFLAYQVSFDDSATLSEMQDKCAGLLENLVQLARAKNYTLFLTPSGSRKGDRADLAIQRPYQGNRAGKEKPKMLEPIRYWMAKELGATLCTLWEADDGMSMAQHADPDNTIIVSKDKDLRMVPGLHMDWDTGNITDTGGDPFGWIELLRTKTTGGKPKIKLSGRGYKFFFAQLLMGDAADSITGLPKWIDPDTGKATSCGPVLTHAVLDGARTVEEAYRIVAGAYLRCGEYKQFVHHATQAPVSAAEVLLSEMQLLWLRRKPDKYDCAYWLQEQLTQGVHNGRAN